MIKKLNNKLTWMVFGSLTLLIGGAIFSFSNESLFSSGQHAMGYFASGQFACGVFAAGQFAVGVFAVGIFSFGVFSLGIFNIGLYAVGIYILGKKYSKKRSIDVLQLVKWKFKPTVILGLLVVASYSDAQAQLVNGDFEAWSDQGAYWSPDGFATPNALSQNGYYAVTRSEDHPVSSEGMYSARIESKASLLPAASAYGLILQNPSQNFLEGIKPSFPVQGHPTELKGFFKYHPQNGDRMVVLAQLFYQGDMVGIGQFSTEDTTAEWSEFTVQISDYLQADSIALLVASYYALGGPPEYRPEGNSVLYIDDLSLSGDAASVSDKIEENKLKVYPNPCQGTVRVLSANEITKVQITNAAGQEIWETEGANRLTEIDMTAHPLGIYYIKVYTKLGVTCTKLVYTGPNG